MIVVLKFLPFGEVLFLGCDRWIVVARAGTVGVVLVGLAVGVLIGLVGVGLVLVGLVVTVLVGLMRVGLVLGGLGVGVVVLG